MQPLLPHFPSNQSLFLLDRTFTQPLISESTYVSSLYMMQGHVTKWYFLKHFPTSAKNSKKNAEGLDSAHNRVTSPGTLCPM